MFLLPESSVEIRQTLEGIREGIQEVKLPILTDLAWTCPGMLILGQSSERQDLVSTGGSITEFRSPALILRRLQPVLNLALALSVRLWFHDYWWVTSPGLLSQPWSSCCHWQLLETLLWQGVWDGIEGGHPFTLSMPNLCARAQECCVCPWDFGGQVHDLRSDIAGLDSLPLIFKKIL